jgi:hypothetical protein
MLTIFAACHLAAMSTAVTNPVLYGFLNENFKQVGWQMEDLPGR